MLRSETEKIRDLVRKYCIGSGIDIGARHDKILPEALSVDIEDVYDVDRVLDASKPLPFRDCEFAYVYSSHCLEHIQDTKTTLIEWVRILKYGGYIILYLPHKDLYKMCNPDHKHDFIPSDITSLLEQLGCSIVLNIIHQYSFLIVAKL